MLLIKPNCECCDKDLPAASEQAFICSYECTFCRDCVDNVLENVCPNCGGGLVPRPIRPSKEHRSGVSLAHQSPAKERVHSPYAKQEITLFSQGIKHTPPAQR